jgi:hypothetical protein
MPKQNDSVTAISAMHAARPNTRPAHNTAQVTAHRHARVHAGRGTEKGALEARGPDTARGGRNVLRLAVQMPDDGAGAPAAGAALPGAAAAELAAVAVAVAGAAAPAPATASNGALGAAAGLLTAKTPPAMWAARRPYSTRE